MYLAKTTLGYIPVDDLDHQESQKVAQGEIGRWVRSRNPLFHKKMFSLFKLYFENSEKYTTFEGCRKVTLMKAGYVIWEKDKHGKSFPLPESLQYDKMPPERFEQCYNDVLGVISEELNTAPELIRQQLEGF